MVRYADKKFTTQNGRSYLSELLVCFQLGHTLHTLSLFLTRHFVALMIALAPTQFIQLCFQFESHPFYLTFNPSGSAYLISAFA